MLVASLCMSMYFSKSINNVKRFFKGDAGDYKPIGCVSATLNNSVLYKTHISCDDTVEYFACKQSEYFFMVMFTVFTKCVRCTPLRYFMIIFSNLNFCNFSKYFM